MASGQKKKSNKPKPKAAKSTGATFSLVDIAKDRDKLELLDGSIIYFKSITDFDDVDLLSLQKQIAGAQGLGDEIVEIFGKEGADVDENKTAKALKAARQAMDGVLRVVLDNSTTEDQLQSIGGIQVKMQVVQWWTEQNIGKKAQGQQA